MNESFKDGFEKTAYDYKYEVDRKERYAKARQGDKPVSWKSALGIGAGLGASAGAIMGALNPSKTALVKKLVGSSAVGALGGAAVGALYRVFDELDISAQKRIMNMPKGERLAYLASKARDAEFRQREAYKSSIRRAEKIL